ncbi:Planctomycete cytochrome C [Botrimarina colliarenosi]|uniref:Planctomycete cytochrome C n=1 Tax=Botrimarina colliarenosi TaxID=2528001 RepID=A0A5C6AFJ0_9BACT|nr:PSD1 and planctomycete cytochrome C domain-containing protein [Botrimarina colliarenosi]TWT97831.1 Planctomycete cytochrome C [Botrimarina colliarenosi]
MPFFSSNNSAIRLGVLLVGLQAASGVRADNGPAAPQFNRDIRPILSDSCFSCHGPGTQEAGLRLDSFEGATDWAVIPGDPDASELMARVTSADPDTRMPPPESNRPAVDADAAAKLHSWIAGGAAYQPHWSYLPLQQVPPPTATDTAWPRGPIDQFILAGLEERQIRPSPEADRETLARRVYLDVIGLPPSTAELDAFLTDNRPDAYERLVDQLLASPRYAERMATWWFDLVRFSDTVGYHGDQDQRIAPYRDYVLKSYNENLPFDQFTIEQLAGDLLPDPNLWQRVATGYNRILQTSHEGGIQDAEYRAKMLADRVRNVSEVWLAASLGCAECHDHKFDPFTQRDFYRMAAFFADVDSYNSFEPVSSNTTPTSRPPEILAWTLPVYEQLQAIDAEINEVLGQLTGEIPGPRATAELRAKLKKLRHRRVEIEDHFEPTMVTAAVEPKDVRVLSRGDWMDETGEVVTPGGPTSLKAPLSAGDERLTRLDLARWLVAGESNPVTPRVVVNRLWKIYFGAGLTKSLIDMGSQGDPPVYPELLDWLARDFVASGWDLKHVVRQMVTSSVYRQGSAPRDELRDLDPQNRWLARQSRSRLEAEQLRDTALQAAGLLHHQLGGGFAKPYQPPGYYAQLSFPERRYQASQGTEQYRRGVYTHWQRQYLHPWLMAFDAPTRDECTAQRPVSNTPSAALVLLNDPCFVEASRSLAARALSELADDASDGARLRWAWREATGRRAHEDEIDALTNLLARHRDHYAAEPEAAEQLVAVGQTPRPDGVDAAELAAWTSVGRTLLNLSETITRD